MLGALVYGTAEDWLTVNGYAMALHLAMKIEDAGMAVLAPVCSTWTFMNSGTSAVV
jgi:hypothetical protein